MLERSFITALTLALVACSSSSESSTSNAPDAGSPAQESGAANVGDAEGGSSAAVLIVGQLADSDLTQAQAQHDALEKSVQASATSLGDAKHTVLLGTSLLGTTPNQFFALDRWSGDASINSFYQGSAIQSGFGQLFSPAPTVTVYLPATSWAGYGTPDSGDSANPYFWVVVRGTMKYADLSQDQAIHDSIVSQVAPQAQAAGDVGHVVYTGRDVPTLYFSIDVWPASTDLASFYGNPQFATALSNLFDGAPTVGIYQSTQWYQW